MDEVGMVEGRPLGVVCITGCIHHIGRTTMTIF